MNHTAIKKIAPAGSAIMLSLLLSVPAFAEAISGQITNINQQNNTVTLQPRDQQKFNQQQLQITMENDIFQQSRQVRSINDLAVGDQITVEADKAMFGDNWEAESLVSVQSQGGQSPQQQPAQSGQAGTAGLQQTPSPFDAADYIVRGTVVSTDPATNSVIVTDYATGLDRTFTVMDTDVLNTLQAGEEVTLQSASAGSAGQQGMQQQSAQGQASQPAQQSPASSAQGGQSQAQGQESMQSPMPGSGQSSGSAANPSASSQGQAGSQSGQGQSANP